MGANAFVPPINRSSRSGNTHTFRPECRDGHAHSLGKSSCQTGSAQTRAVGLGCARGAITHMMIVLHISQILLWAGCFRWNCFPSWESAFYFSITSYSTVGYGDLVLPSSWRILGPIEAITGVLMCGLSAGFLFAIVTRLVEHESQMVPAPTKRPAVLSVLKPF